MYPNYTTMQESQHQHQRENENARHDEYERESKLIKKNNCKTMHNFAETNENFKDREVKQNPYSIIANNTFEMRLKVLKMEKNTLETYFVKQIIDNENDTWRKIHDIDTYIGVVSTHLEINYFEDAENELLIAENLSTELMRKIKMVLYKKKSAEKEIVQKPKDHVEVPDYRSTVTVSGAEEDVINCILKATAALENGKYDKAERLLLKAERMFPTQNARNLLKKVRAAKDLKGNPELIEKATKTAEPVYSLKNEELKSEMDNWNANKCLNAFEKSFTTGNFEKAERLLHKTKRFKPTLEIEENMSRVKAAMVNNMEEKSKNILEEANRDQKTAGEYFYKSIKTHDADNSTKVKRNLSDPKSLNPFLDSESHLSKNNSVIASRNSADEKSNISMHDQPIADTTFEDQVYRSTSGKYHYKQMKMYDTNNTTRVERNINKPNTNNPFLNLDDDPVIASTNSREENLKISRYSQPVTYATFEDQPFSFEKSNNKMKTQIKNITDRDDSSSNDKQETFSKNHLLDGNYYEYTNVVGDLKLEKSHENSNTIKISPYNHANDYTAENAVEHKRFKDDTAERFKPISQTKPNINLSSNENICSNSYNIPAEASVSNKTEALECIEIREVAFPVGQYGRTEHFPLKPQKICDNQSVQSNLELVLKAKPQTNTNVTAEIEKNDNKHFNNHSQNEQINEYYKCTGLTTMYIKEGNLTKAEHFLKKAIRMNPNEAAIAQLKLIQDTIASQNSSGSAVTSKAVKNEKGMKLDKESEILKNLAFDARNKYNFGAALYYAERALKKQLDETTRNRLENLREEIVRQNRRPLFDTILEANMLLDKVLVCLCNEDIEKADSLLIISWDMNKTSRTTLIYKQFLEARMSVYGKMLNRRNVTNNGNIKNIYESDLRVNLALDEYDKKQFKKAKKLLIQARQYHTSPQIDRLLFEIDSIRTRDDKLLCCLIT